MNTRPHLASMERRVTAFVIDALLVCIVVLTLGAAAESLGVRNSAIAAFALAALVAYHSAGLANRDIGFGRVVMAISVISLKSGPELSRLQCIARPLVRLAWICLGIVPATVFREPIFLCTPLVVDVALLTFHPLRQTVADLVCRTVVVNLPPLQPHRAPAGPMFSPDDAEFGPKPRGSKANRSIDTDPNPQEATSLQKVVVRSFPR